MRKTLRLTLAASAVLVLGVAGLSAFAEAVLPDGYTRLDYIESDGNQYIDTGYIPQYGDTEIVTACIPHMQQNPKVYTSLFGCYDEPTGGGPQFNTSSTTEHQLRYYFSGRSQTKVYANVYGRDIRFVFDASGMSWANADGSGDGGSLQFASPAEERVCESPLYLFANSKRVSSGSVTPQYRVTTRLYSFQVLSDDGSTVQLDLIPCRNPDGVVGLYNLGSYAIPGGNFLANKGTGSFRTSDLDGVRLVSIESTGQYIDTNYKFKYDDVVTMKMNLQREDAVSSSKTVIGSYDETTYYMFNSPYSSDSFRVFRTSSAMFQSKEDIYGRPLIFTLDWMKGLSWIDEEDETKSGEVAFPAAPTQTSSSAPTFIFARADLTASTGTLKPNGNACGTLYSFDISSGSGEKRRRFVPFRRAGGKVGLLDLVEERFYPNAYTGDFIAGADAYAVSGRTAIVESGAFLPELADGFDLVRKTGAGTFEAGSATGFKALSVEAGAYSVQDGEAKRQVIAGALKLNGGATLKVDVTPDGCDSFAAGSVDLSGASASNRITIDIARIGDATFGRGKLKLIESGLSAGDEDKFAVVCGEWNAGVRVRDGALVICPVGFMVIIK